MSTVSNIRVSEIGEFIRFQSCERRFKLGLNNRQLARAVPFSERLFNSLDPVLQEVGRQAENDWEDALAAQGIARLAVERSEKGVVAWHAFAEALSHVEIGSEVYCREVEITGQVGAFQLSGRMDFVVLLWDEGAPRLRIVEGKASRKDRTYHRIQLAAYILLLEQSLNAMPIDISGTRLEDDAVVGTVVRIDENTNEPQDMLARQSLNLDTEMADVSRLLATDGLLASVVARDLDALEYQLDAKCDGCVFSVHCLPESARQRRLELVGIAPNICRVLRDAGVPGIDALADLDPASPVADGVRRAAGFDMDLDQLIASASARRSTLPRAAEDPPEYQVQSLPHSGRGQLPPHEMMGQRLVRVYLEVDYDYTENRVGALAAHVTSSDGHVRTPFGEDRRPVPGLVETPPDDTDAQSLVQGRDVMTFQTAPWSGKGDQDTGAERQMIQQFLFDVIEAIAEVAKSPNVPIHFYVYSRSEMTQLVEACTRAGSVLLSHLRELLGSRQNLEQLIFSCIQDEIDDRFALGWTGRGLAVASSLTWFGQRFHWTRMVAGVPVELDRIFEQDIFDFRSTLDVDAGGAWTPAGAPGSVRRRFEIRSRFHDTLTAPYWRAVWRSLPADVEDPRTRAAIDRYRRAEQPGLVRAYLHARVHALRWLDERIRFKNEEIEKPPLEVASLQVYELGIDTTARAGVDFLRLDHHVRMTDWLTSNIRPPAARVQTGRTIPLRNVRTNAEGKIVADFDIARFGLTAEELSLRSSIDEGSFVRLSPWFGEVADGQTLRQLTHGGSTCLVTAVDWINGTIQMDSLFLKAATYLLRSGSYAPHIPVFDFATVDESPSDFIAGNVEDRLIRGLGRHVFEWFEPSRPSIPAVSPIPPARLGRMEALLAAWQAPHATGAAPLIHDQARAVLDGLSTRVQLLKGPPGTGKTVTTAASIFARVAARLRRGGIVLVAAHTNLAVDTLMQRLLRYRDSFRAEAEGQGLEMPEVVLSRVHSSRAPLDDDGIRNFSSKSCATKVKDWREEGALVIGGTTNGLLKMARELSDRRPFKDQLGGFCADVLVVDEASMMVFPHFLALATLVSRSGEIMLAGDNRQLSPIVAHDWENEDRPPAQHYQPFKSAYEAIMRIVDESRPSPAECRQSALTYTFRLPPIIRELISRIYGDLDDIVLEGPLLPPAQDAGSPTGDWSDIWNENEGLVLVVHSERSSRQSNPLEAELIETILMSRDQLPADSIAVITPHRAQRALLKGRLATIADAASIIDTVEKVQGGERPIIVVSGTESDPHSIGAAASFILNLNRANVAFSRTQERLIVVCAETLLDHVPSDLEDYESAMLWKSLRNLCRRMLFTAEVGGHRVRVLSPERRV
ncbi:bifunctional RecB family nuclease/DEAD/DEAH box helicase [Rhizobium leguminosarum]|uniref:bifunctional RecB family nuclease/DEAD/DEAH box helicase n=1 Tax=Rhizobium leguminosarum TaxID=384 RepID=UPI0013DA231B|nr:AAA domain-containing protein [Rhizobium leguminosarum]NEI02418.1 AAA family ATPase [Rhizobium leguminosarum]